MQEIAIVVPVRLASSRFPGKPLFEIKGRPLILWTAQRIADEAPELPLFFAVEDDGPGRTCVDVLYRRYGHSVAPDQVV